MDEDFNPLDGMLEVVMEEEEQEIDVQPGSNYTYELPPIPTFDLQTEQFTYLAPQPSTSSSYVVPAQKTGKVNAQKGSVASKSIVKVAPARKPLTVAVPSKPMRIFPPSMKIVATVMDGYPKNLSETTYDELSFYNTLFNDIRSVERYKLHCTICNKHIGCAASSAARVRAHRMLRVLICATCFNFYGDGNFPTDKSDNTEIYCRWCGQGGVLVCCSYCPKVFCNDCVVRNYDKEFLQEIEKASDWACFCCAQKPLWPLRGVCRALMIYLKKHAGPEDRSLCCPHKTYNKPYISVPKKLPPKPSDSTFSPTGAAVSSTEAKTPTVLQPGVMQSFGNLAQPKKFCQIPATMAKTTPVTRLPAPVIKPQPLPKIAPKTVVNNTANKSSMPNNMPEVRIDHTSIDSTVVRLRMANAKDQYLRVNIVGACQRVPAFPAKPTFTLTSLLHAFRLNRMAFDKFKMLKEKMEKSKMGGLVAESQHIRNSLVKWKELISDIEADLEYNCRVYEAIERKKNAEVIDLDDDEDLTMKWKFVSVGKNHFMGESDVEVIDCDEPVAHAPALIQSMPTVAKKRKAEEPPTPPTRKMPRRSASKVNGTYRDFGGSDEDDAIDDHDFEHEMEVSTDDDETYYPSSHHAAASFMSQNENSAGSNDANENKPVQEDRESDKTVSGTETTSETSFGENSANNNNKQDSELTDESHSDKTVSGTEPKSETSAEEDSANKNNNQDSQPASKGLETADVGKSSEEGTEIRTEPETTLNAVEESKNGKGDLEPEEAGEPDEISLQEGKSIEVVSGKESNSSCLEAENAGVNNVDPLADKLVIDANKGNIAEESCEAQSDVAEPETDLSPSDDKSENIESTDDVKTVEITEVEAEQKEDAQSDSTEKKCDDKPRIEEKVEKNIVQNGTVNESNEGSTNNTSKTDDADEVGSVKTDDEEQLLGDDEVTEDLVEKVSEKTVDQDQKDCQESARVSQRFEIDIGALNDSDDDTPDQENVVDRLSDYSETPVS